MRKSKSYYNCVNYINLKNICIAIYHKLIYLVYRAIHGYRALDRTIHVWTSWLTPPCYTIFLVAQRQVISKEAIIYTNCKVSILKRTFQGSINLNMWPVQICNNCNVQAQELMCCLRASVDIRKCLCCNYNTLHFYHSSKTHSICLSFIMAICECKHKTGGHITHMCKQSF